MQPGLIEHAGIVQRIEGQRAIVAIETHGCASCGHGGHCGIGQLAKGRPATLLAVPIERALQPGEPVTIALPVSQLARSALLGYLLPALAMLLGAAAGGHLLGSDLATALGALSGLALAIAAARLALHHLPGLRPSLRLISSNPSSDTSPNSPPNPGARP